MFKKYFIFFVSFAFLGCSHRDLMTIDSPIPPSELLWAKEWMKLEYKKVHIDRGDGRNWMEYRLSGIGYEELMADKKQCREVSRQLKYSYLNVRDNFDLCMLKKGYKFFPRGFTDKGYGTGYQSICEPNNNSIHCQSYRGKYIKELNE
ncbi:MAG: hypothetical protein WC163_04910 [Sulfurovum sp.]|jgi:hypothetical protein